jgi:hypothetical protein
MVIFQNLSRSSLPGVSYLFPRGGAHEWSAQLVVAGGRGGDGGSTTDRRDGDGGRTGAEDQEWCRRDGAAGWQQFDADAARPEPSGAVVLEDGAQRKGRPWPRPKAA